MKKPNILWICSDQQRWDTLGCYGNTHTHTKNIDALAEEGIVFENAYVQNPVCSPSRSSFLTGRYPRVTKCRQNGQVIDNRERVVSKILSDAGYFCGLSGKYHINPADPKFYPQGEPRIDDGYSIFEWAHGHAYKHPSNAYQKWLKDIDVEYTKQNHEQCQWIEYGMPAEHHQTTWCVERAMSFIDTSKDFNMPWMFSVNIFDPHNPFDPPKDYLERYTDHLSDIPLPNYVEGELEDKPKYQSILHDSPINVNPENIKTLKPAEMSDDDHRYVKAAYWAMCDLIDDQVGRLVDYLKQVGEYENTIIVYMSDHGEMLGDHGLYYKALNMYDSAVRVPFIIHYPKMLKPKRYPNPLEIMHIAPTLIDAAGLPKESAMQCDSLWPKLTEGEEILGEDVYCEYYNSIFERRLPSHECFGTMLRSDRYKLIMTHGTSEGELYDMKEDPKETVNLFNKKDYAEAKSEMLIKLCNKMAWTSDPDPVRKGYF